MPSFTTQIPNLRVRGPVMSIQIAIDTMTEESLRLQGDSVPTPVSVMAMVDPGATQTIIREDLVQRLNLKPLSALLVTTPVSTEVECYQFPVRLFLFPEVAFECAAIAASLQYQDIQCLIGRDILQHGIFIYLGHNESFTLSF